MLVWKPAIWLLVRPASGFCIKFSAVANSDVLYELKLLLRLMTVWLLRIWVGRLFIMGMSVRPAGV